MSAVLPEPTQILSEKLRRIVPEAATSSFFEQGILSRTGSNAWQPIAVPVLRVQIDGTEVRISGAPDPLPAWFLPTLQSVVPLLLLESGWDSYGAHPVDRYAAEVGIGLLLQVMPTASAAPNVVPGSQGELQFEWHQNGFDVEIEVSRDGTASFIVAELSSDSEIEGDSSDLTRLQEALIRISE